MRLSNRLSRKEAERLESLKRLHKDYLGILKVKLGYIAFIPLGYGRLNIFQVEIMYEKMRILYLML